MIVVEDLFSIQQNNEPIFAKNNTIGQIFIVVNDHN